MSGGTGPVTPQADWNILIDSGDEVALYGDPYFFDRVDPDGAVTFRAPLNSGRGEFMVQGVDGRPRKPTTNEIGTIWREEKLEFREKRLESGVRRFAREVKYDADQVRAKDKYCSFRVAMLRKYDLHPCSRSDRSLRSFLNEALTDPDIAKLRDKRKVGPSTFRSWLNERGTAGCRKERDGISMSGRMPRQPKIGHPIEIAQYWAVRANWVRGDIQKNYDRYSADITKINKGEDLNRFFLIDPDGGALALATHRGHRHIDNQDSGGFRRYDDGRIALVVCDGVSTAYTSRLAADTAVACVLDAMAQKADDIEAELKAAIEAAHGQLCALPYDDTQNLAEPQATIVAAVVSSGKAHVAWVGDSRGYIVIGGEARQLTRDDSWLNDQIEHGASYETALHDPNAHCITQCLGMRDDTPVVNVITTDLPASGWLLLCSDGLWNYAPEVDDLIAAFPGQGLPGERVTALVDFANRHGGIDNVTVALLELG